MWHDYVDPSERSLGDPNQDVVYGLSYMDLGKEPVIVQVPEFGDRYWVIEAEDARADEFSNLGKQYGTKPGFYMIVGPNWQSATPDGIAGVLRSSTNGAISFPRIFMVDTPEDRAAIQPLINQIMFYPLSQFDGKMKTKDWSKIPAVKKEGKPAKYSNTQPAIGRPGDLLRPVASDHERSPTSARNPNRPSAPSLTNLHWNNPNSSSLRHV